MRMQRLSKIALVTLGTVGLGVAPAMAMTASPASHHAPGAGRLSPDIIVGPVVSHLASQLPPPSYCVDTYGIGCYQPSDIQNQYNFGPLYANGDNGAGQTIVIFDSFGSPTIRQDLATFDAAFNLPAPPSFNIYMPQGKVTYNYTNSASPAYFNNKNMGTEIGWAYETTLDVEWSHAIAPGASIDLVVIPTSETEGVQGVPNMQNAQAWALSHGLGKIWSDSWSTTEQSFNTPSSIRQLDSFYATVASQGVTAFFATGDSGAANVSKQGAVYPYATVCYPPASANVVAVGGTQISTPVPTGSISSYQPEATWNDGYGAGGGGFSTVFSEPSYQSGAGITDPTGMRGLPDVSANAAVLSAVLIYESFDPTAGAGWLPIAGTSEATPLWAGTDAVMSQADGSLGFLAPRLYQIYQNPALYSEAFHDITVGNNSFAGVTGYSAGTGWDAATGLGTPNAAGLAAALMHTTP